MADLTPEVAAAPPALLDGDFWPALEVALAQYLVCQGEGWAMMKHTDQVVEQVTGGDVAWRRAWPGFWCG